MKQHIQYQPRQHISAAKMLGICGGMHLKSAERGGIVRIQHPRHSASTCSFNPTEQTLTFTNGDDPSCDKILRTLAKRMPLKRVA